MNPSLLPNKNPERITKKTWNVKGIPPIGRIKILPAQLAAVNREILVIL